MAFAGLVLLALAGMVALWPPLLVAPFTLFCLWMAIALLIKAYQLRRDVRAQGSSWSPPRRQ
jgi:hypothetical protein